MQSISGVPVDALKKSRFSDADIEYILEQTEKYRRRRERQEHEGVPENLRQEIIEIATGGFQTGMVVRIAKARITESQ